MIFTAHSSCLFHYNLQIDRNYHFRALDHLTLPTRDLKAFQEETLLDGELVWDEGKGEMIYFIFDGLMFNAKNICGLDLNGRLQVIQNDVIGPYEKREGTKKANATIYEQSFPFKMKMKQMWKPYGLKELFERVIPAQGHENDGLIFTPVKDTYQAGTCHRLLKWKPSELNSIDFLICAGTKAELWIASQGRCHYYCDFDPKADEKLKAEADINDRIAEFRLTPNHPNKWTFMRFRPDKRLPNDSKTVEKVIQSIKDNVKRSDLVERETVIRANWKARELKGASAGSVQGANTKVPAATVDIGLIPRSQRIKPPVSFKYPLNLRTDTAKNEYKEADGWFDENESEDDESDHAESVKDSSSITNTGLCYDLDSEEENNNLKKKRARTK